MRTSLMLELLRMCAPRLWMGTGRYKNGGTVRSVLIIGRGLNVQWRASQRRGWLTTTNGIIHVTLN